MILETSRLILRPFLDEDIGRFAELMANRDFMRFSLGPYTREQTQSVSAEIPLLEPGSFAFAVCGYFSQQQ